MLFNEPKLLKSRTENGARVDRECFSALQRAEIAEINRPAPGALRGSGFSALQRAEIAEMERIERRACAVCAEFQCSSTSRNC